MYIKGYPAQLCEAILASIDAHAILYALSKQGTYNARVFSSMMAESFFVELTNQDKRGHGALTAAEFSSDISNASEQMQAKLDKDMSFFYRSTVYRPVENLPYGDNERNDTAAAASDDLRSKTHFKSLTIRYVFSTF